MKPLTLLAAVLTLALTLVAGDADAKRLGGGRSSGMQREAVTADKSFAPSGSTAMAPSAARTQPAAATAAQAAQPKRSWLGPLAGLAAGLGLAALASHFGFGEELASMLMIGLLVMVVLAVIGFIMRRRAAAQQPAMAAAASYPYAAREYEHAPASASNVSPLMPANDSYGSTAAPRNIPADFDVEGFVRNAKVNFIRLQAANDAGNIDDLREFTTPEMFAELKMDFAERGQTAQHTDVVSIEAEVLDVTEEATRYVVSVRFTGLIREDKHATPESVDEIWHLVKPRDGKGGWVLAGIQQTP